MQRLPLSDNRQWEAFFSKAGIAPGTNNPRCFTRFDVHGLGRTKPIPVLQKVRCLAPKIVLCRQDFFVIKFQ